LLWLENHASVRCGACKPKNRRRLNIYPQTFQDFGLSQ
jgi:hypothetical protein